MELKYIYSLLIFLLFINYSYVDNKNIILEEKNFLPDQSKNLTELRQKRDELKNNCSNLTQEIQENQFLIAKHQMYVIILIIIAAVLFLIIFVYSITKICTRKKENNDLLNTIIAEFDNNQSGIINNNDSAEYNRNYNTSKRQKNETINPDAFISDPNDQKLYRPYSVNEIN